MNVVSSVVTNAEWHPLMLATPCNGVKSKTKGKDFGNHPQMGAFRYAGEL